MADVSEVETGQSGTVDDNQRSQAFTDDSITDMMEAKQMLAFRVTPIS